MKHDFRKLLKEFKDSPQSATLNKEQMEFIDEFFLGGNIFLTGSAGCGKSYVVKVLFDFLDKNGVNCVARTAATGVSALTIGGSTIFSWAGIGLAEGTPKSIASEVVRNKKAKERILNTKIIFIDEISMISGEVLDKINAVFKLVRNSDKSFGGMKVVLLGDWLQLQPIFKGDNSKYAFESDAWENLNLKCINLTQVMRQDKDGEFAKVLEQLRFGDTSSVSLIKSRIGAKFPDDGIKPIKLFCKNYNVDKNNEEELAKINSKEEVFYAKDDGPPWISDHFDKNCLAPKVLKLKVGAQVMLLRNIDVENGYVNGSIGVVESFTPEGPKVKFTCGTSIISKETWELKEQAVKEDGEVKFKVIGSRTQIPLKLAYSISIHKCQSLTLSRVYLDISDAFSYGHSYTGLSRVKNLESLSMADFHDSKIMANGKCVEFYKNINNKNKEIKKKNEVDSVDL